MDDLRRTSGPDVEPPLSPSLAVFVPSEHVRPGDLQVRLALRRLEDDRLVLLAWTTLAGLVASCGPSQPWVGVGAGELAVLRERSGASEVLLDVDLSEAEETAA